MTTMLKGSSPDATLDGLLDAYSDALRSYLMLPLADFTVERRDKARAAIHAHVEREKAALWEERNDALTCVAQGLEREATLRAEVERLRELFQELNTGWIHIPGVQRVIDRALGSPPPAGDDPEREAALALLPPDSPPPATAKTTDAMPYPADKGGTHWEGCYRTPGHHNCAVAEVDRLRDDAGALDWLDSNAIGFTIRDGEGVERTYDDSEYPRSVLSFRDLVEMAVQDAALASPPPAEEQECPDCDGCGWTEGGESLQSGCSRCSGSGIVAVSPPPAAEAPPSPCPPHGYPKREGPPVDCGDWLK